MTVGVDVIKENFRSFLNQDAARPAQRERGVVVRTTGGAVELEPSAIGSRHLPLLHSRHIRIRCSSPTSSLAMSYGCR
jgi:hypothetical protein